MATTLALAIFLAQNSTMDAATTPAHRLGDAWWKERHERCVETTKKAEFDVAFLGDSITQGWEGEGREVWKSEFEPLKAANFGFSGDRTEHVLWRLANGEIVGAQPKVVVIMIGTNNVGHASFNPEQTAKGVRKVVEVLRAGLPSAKILLLGIFPRGKALDDPMRVRAMAATDRFKGVADGKSVHFMDIGANFVHQTGELRMDLLPDQLHLNREGYAFWAKAVKPKIVRLLGSKE